MEILISFLNSLSGFVWGPAMLVLLVGTGLYLTVGLKFFTFTQMPKGLLEFGKAVQVLVQVKFHHLMH